MKTKRIALLLSVLFVLGLFQAACDNDSPSPAASPDDTGGGGGLTNVEKGPAEVGPVPAGAVDFSDGNFGFVMANLAPADADAALISVADFKGGKALRIETTDGMVPYVGFDVSSMYGDRVADIRTIEMRIWSEHPAGFFAVGGTLEIFTGAENRRSSEFWGVSLERNNPRVLSAELAANVAFVPGSKNIIQLKKASDNSPDALTVLYIDYLICYDASGSVIPADTTVGFNPPDGFGAGDTTFLFDTVDDVIYSFMDNNASGSSSGWGQAGMIDKGSLNWDDFRPGAIFTVAYESTKAPELIFQSWSDGPVGWAKVEPFMVNYSGTVAQYRYEDAVEAFGTDDFETFLDRINIGDRDSLLTVNAFLIGQRTHEIVYDPIRKGDDGFVDISRLNILTGSCGEWGQAFRMNTPGMPNEEGYPAEFDVAWLTPGGNVTVVYEGAEPPELILQRTNDRTADPQIWCKAVPEISKHDVERGIIQWSTDDMIDAWIALDGGAFEDELCTFWVGGTRSDVTVFLVVIQYVPEDED